MQYTIQGLSDYFEKKKTNPKTTKPSPQKIIKQKKTNTNNPISVADYFVRHHYLGPN